MESLINDQDLGHGFAYRIEDWRVSLGVDEYGDPIPGGKAEVTMWKLPILRHTPKGFWVETKSGEERFVLTTARKRYACLTKTEALESFIARKDRQRSIYLSRAEGAAEAKSLAIRRFYKKEVLCLT